MTFRSGFVAVVGRPNTGKSTVVNALVGQKVSIVTDKAQTTRGRIRGVPTTDQVQIVHRHARVSQAALASRRAAQQDGGG